MNKKVLASSSGRDGVRVEECITAATGLLMGHDLSFYSAYEAMMQKGFVKTGWKCKGGRDPPLRIGGTGGATQCVISGSIKAVVSPFCSPLCGGQMVRQGGHSTKGFPREPPRL